LGELLLTNRAKQDLAVLPPILQEAILDTLTLLEARPDELGKELRGRLRGLWSCRVGSYRVLFTIEGKGGESRVIVRAIRHRAIAYGGHRRRRRSS
jgi:mRNA-degrading endonuclease RelE of RelBE toxin-antitoxin system